MAFAPASPYMQWNATPGTLWLRFTLLDDGSEPLFLRWFRATTDQVTVYLPSTATNSQGGPWREHTLSATLPMKISQKVGLPPTEPAIDFALNSKPFVLGNCPTG